MTAVVNGPVLTPAIVTGNRLVCREHRRLTLRVREFPESKPAQFVHLIQSTEDTPPRLYSWGDGSWPSLDRTGCQERMTFRRAFSIADQRRAELTSEVDVIYRIVGLGTRWLASLTEADIVDLMGPVGNCFTIEPHVELALLVAGGVGLPPMLPWARALREQGVTTVALCGAQSADLFPLALDPLASFDVRAVEPASGVAEFDAVRAGVILTTEDGTLGMHGRVTEALARFVEARRPAGQRTSIYTCGPEPMMRRVAELAAAWGMRCQACMERSMACGMGTCQSCVVPIRDASAASGFHYRLCCTQGPVFDAADVLWD